MMPLLIVGLEKPYLKEMGFQEMFCVQPTNLNPQGLSKDLAPSHGLPLFTELPRRSVFSEAELPALPILGN
jgi:hypothetical protein